MNKQKQAFTLVELIVVITILAILGTIAFISLQWYSRDSRDSVRISDAGNMKVALELFYLDAGKYPLPDNNEIISYSWDTVWYQWTFWENVVINLSRNITEIPKDPLMDKEYTYSVEWLKNSYQILTLLEWDDTTLNISWKANAWNLIVTPKLDGTYNGIFAKTQNFIVPTPSIITAEDTTWGLVLTQDVLESMVTHRWNNIPEIGNVVYNTWALNDLTLSVWEWSINKSSSESDKVALIEAIKTTYSWSILASNGEINEVLSASWTGQIVAILNTVVLEQPELNSSSSTSSSSEETNPPVNGSCWTDQSQDLVATPTNLCNAGTPTSVTDGWIWSTYTWDCTWLFEWTTANCSANHIAEVTFADCSTSWEILTATSFYDWCDTWDIIVCSWAGAWYTVSACNVWTTTSWLAAASYWELFQWWNNAWMKSSWTSWTQVDASWYGPWNYYNDATFITPGSTENSWTSVYNADLWWHTTNTDEARQWPCATWYHIPSSTEWSGAWNAWGWSTITDISNWLNLPLTGWYNSAKQSLSSSYTYYWATDSHSNLTIGSATGPVWKALTIASPYWSNWTVAYYWAQANGAPVRCFKN